MLKLDHATFPAETRAAVPSKDMPSKNAPSKPVPSCDLPARGLGSSDSGAAELRFGAGQTAGQTSERFRQPTSRQGGGDDQEHPAGFHHPFSVRDPGADRDLAAALLPSGRQRGVLAAKICPRSSEWRNLG